MKRQRHGGRKQDRDPDLPGCNLAQGGMNYAGCHHDVDAAIDSNNHGVLYSEQPSPL